MPMRKVAPIDHIAESPLFFHDMPMVEPAAPRVIATMMKKSAPLPMVSQLLEVKSPFAGLGVTPVATTVRRLVAV